MRIRFRKDKKNKARTEMVYEDESRDKKRKNKSKKVITEMMHESEG